MPKTKCDQCHKYPKEWLNYCQECWENICNESYWEMIKKLEKSQTEIHQ